MASLPELPTEIRMNILHFAIQNEPVVINLNRPRLTPFPPKYVNTHPIFHILSFTSTILSLLTVSKAFHAEVLWLLKKHDVYHLPKSHKHWQDRSHWQDQLRSIPSNVRCLHTPFPCNSRITEDFPLLQTIVVYIDMKMFFGAEVEEKRVREVLVVPQHFVRDILPVPEVTYHWIVDGVIAGLPPLSRFFRTDLG